MSIVKIIGYPSSFKIFLTARIDMIINNGSEGGAIDTLIYQRQLYEESWEGWKWFLLLET